MNAFLMKKWKNLYSIVWVAHASEIPEGGSYKTINIGKQPVVVVRDRKKKVHVLLNRCRHRAATVCEHKRKN